MVLNKEVVGRLDKKKSGNPKNILLINPPSDFLLDPKVFPPLGIATIAAVALERGHEVRLLDLAGKADYVAEVRREVDSRRYDAVGITSTSPQFFYAYRILREGILPAKRKVRTVLGGPHASMFSSLRRNLIGKFEKEKNGSTTIEERLIKEDVNFARLQEFDVIAEGEERALALAVESNEPEKWINGGLTLNLDEIPFPARQLFNMREYLYHADGTPKFKIGRGAAASIISQRGCPYGCTFCCGRDTPQMSRIRIDGKFRVKSPEKIVAELHEMRRDFEVEGAMFYDDEFNLNPRRTMELCEKLKGNGFQYRGFIRTDLLVRNPEVAQAMQEAGFVEVLAGIESGSERILKEHMRKGTTPEINYQAARICMEKGLAFKALTMLGNPGETEKDVTKTRDWLLKVGREYNSKLGPGKFTFDMTVFQPYAGCPIWNNSKTNTGKFSDQYHWVYQTNGDEKNGNGALFLNKIDFSTELGFYKGVPGEYHAFIRTEEVSAEKFVRLRDEIDAEIRVELGMPSVKQN